MPAMRSAPFKNVRLVIWDLDETFWHGTLTEGGIRYNTEHHDIVVELCRRGIMNSICSRNERTAVEEILVGTEIWEYFIFPSIDWSPKADRIAEIVEAVQLRPETVVFVDDHPANLAQAKAALPGLQIADPGAIRDFLSDPGFAGKSDPDLTRLRQYKLLETRHVEMGKAGGNTAEFLRQSNIAVTIIYDVEKHLDRAIELINRTNQLNFTKQRLSEDKTEARAQLLEQIAPFHARAGLVAVCDRYGDYGICGFFLVIGLVAWAKPKLEHFAFRAAPWGWVSSNGSTSFWDSRSWRSSARSCQTSMKRSTGSTLPRRKMRPLARARGSSARYASAAAANWRSSSIFSERTHRAS
jgi:FkbH-like protein